MPISRRKTVRLGADATANRKSSHVDIVLNRKVDYSKSTGLEKYEFVHNALPEVNYDEIHTDCQFLSFSFSAPIIISSMTGGFKRAAYINSSLAEICKEMKIGMGVGSQRQALENTEYLESYRIVRKVSREIFVMSNIGAAQVANGLALENVRRILDMVEANAIAVHLNALQEFIQQEGDRNFRGVLDGISALVRNAGIPVIVKETGAGISAEVAGRLIDVGVSVIDISGAGGTSWAAIEMFRQSRQEIGKKFWNWGISTADALVQVNSLPARKKISIISSGGIRDGIDVAKSIALGADMCSAAQPFLKALERGGLRRLEKEVEVWIEELKGVMFLTGSRNLELLREAKMTASGSMYGTGHSGRVGPWM